jgi:hypothetical protein
MTRWFNVAGPCQPDIHYMLPAAARLPEVADLVAERSYVPSTPRSAAAPRCVPGLLVPAWRAAAAQIPRGHARTETRCGAVQS